MKRLIFIFMSFAIAAPLFSQIRGDTIQVPESYDKSMAKPIIAKTGAIIFNNSDSLYLVNKIRFNYYEELRTILNDSVDFAIDDIILKYEKSLKESDHQYDLLNKNCNEQSELYRRHIAEVKSSIALTSQTLQLTQESLTNANRSLKEANDLLGKARARHIWQKISIAGGGIGIGILLGLLVN